VNDHLEYKNYLGSVMYSHEDNILYGKVVGINDSISYHGRSIDELTKAFYEAIDDYLIMCEAEDLQPDMPFTGILDIAISPGVFKQLTLFSAKNN
jgi:predicted HicB family RNase H-like nuclease